MSNIHRDSPDALPVFIGANEAKKGCSLSQMGDNMFAAVRYVSVHNTLSSSYQVK